jgi:hypothetical protein
MDQMVTEIRSASPSSQGAYPIESATTSSLVFYSDVDSDGLFERIRYTVGTSTLTRGVIKPTGAPLAYVTSTETVATLMTSLTKTTSSPVFQYYGVGYTGSQAPLAATSTLATDVRVIRVTFYVDIKPREAPRPAYVSQIVTIRNLRDD